MGGAIPSRSFKMLQQMTGSNDDFMNVNTWVNRHSIAQSLAARKKKQ